MISVKEGYGFLDCSIARLVMTSVKDGLLDCSMARLVMMSVKDGFLAYCMVS
jgi:hypothetical protein